MIPNEMEAAEAEERRNLKVEVVRRFLPRQNVVIVLLVLILVDLRRSDRNRSGNLIQDRLSRIVGDLIGSDRRSAHDEQARSVAQIGRRVAEEFALVRMVMNRVLAPSLRSRCLRW